MGQLASTAQLRAMLVRRALIAVPSVVLIGLLPAVLAGSQRDRAWFAALHKPSFTPPAAAFGLGFALACAAMGLALALILHSTVTPLRRLAVAAFALALALAVAWSPTFFAAHHVPVALALIGAAVASAAVATALFAMLRPLAAVLMLPCLAWLLFAAIVNLRVDRMNRPGAALAPARPATHISL